MLVHKAYKYRIYPNTEQQQLIQQMFGCCRFVFNHFLGIWNDTYKATGKGLSYHYCATQLPALKQQFDWLRAVDSIALQSTKSIADASWSEFERQISYKAKWYGRMIKFADPFAPTSQTCHVCGFINPEVKNLLVRKWHCPGCDTLHDRDENAAHNIIVMAV